jgi:hypothetical protein
MENDLNPFKNYYPTDIINIKPAVAGLAAYTQVNVATSKVLPAGHAHEAPLVD